MAQKRAPLLTGEQRVAQYKRRLLTALAQTSGPPYMLVDIAQDLYLALLARQEVPFVRNAGGDDETKKDRFTYCVFRDEDLLTAYAKRVINTGSVPPCEGTFASHVDLLDKLRSIAPQVLANLEKR